MDKRLERILPRVQKPARYVGGEYNEIKKDKKDVELRVAFCFPDTYEIGMSNLGFRILYGIMNNMPGVWCERVFAPWGDMEEELRKADIPLYALESGDPIGDFDVVAFSVGYEMAYPAILNMLDLGGIPLHASQRTELAPLVIAGGTSMYNAEPLADFIDLALIGEGEDEVPELLELYRRAKREGWTKSRFLRAAADIQGVYVPSLYDVTYNDDGTVRAITPLDGAPAKVYKRVVHDMDKSYFPVKTIIPSTEIVHDRVMLELFRGCIRGCRFCQAGMTYRPVRERSADQIVSAVMSGLARTGYDEVSLTSLSTTDHSCCRQVLARLNRRLEDTGISVSIPSQRLDAFGVDMALQVAGEKKGGLTFAPEAGSQRLRDVINKNVTEDDLERAARAAFEAGWRRVKLYFMMGLPGETDDDIVAIGRLADRVYEIAREVVPPAQRGGVSVSVSCSVFIPKAATPFQWCAQTPDDEVRLEVADDFAVIGDIPLGGAVDAHDRLHQGGLAGAVGAAGAISPTSSRPSGGSAPGSTPGPSSSPSTAGSRPPARSASTCARSRGRPTGSTSGCPGSMSAAGCPAATSSGSTGAPSRASPRRTARGPRAPGAACARPCT
mgnify:CR=1 FL=1